MNNITAEDRKRVKSMGFLSNKDGEHFSVRLITENGVMTAEQMRNVCEMAEKFGNGNISFTTRLTVELPGIKYEDIDAVRENAAKANIATGGTGAKIRPVVACKGTVCVFGLIDTQGLATEIHKRFYEGYIDVKLPHKFKIAVGGCPNNCVKPSLNDFGIIGQNIYNKENKTSIRGYKVYIGGRWGRSYRIGTPIEKVFEHDEVLDILEKTILFFRENGYSGERFGSTIDRLGAENVINTILNDDILKRKEIILTADLKTNPVINK
ncbi:MAG: putative nitrite and sulfite reductase subunit [Clostridia bacterium]|nr:putative nitrite and sulfite reductase subunit [Clostridia bacterium]